MESVFPLIVAACRYSRRLPPRDEQITHQKTARSRGRRTPGPTGS